MPESVPESLGAFQAYFEALVVPSGLESQEIKGIKPAGLKSATGAFEVYRRAYRARLIDSLCETYEATWTVLGDKRFFDLCNRYIDVHPSQTYNVSNYGNLFPEFIDARNSFPGLVFLPSLARFERMFWNLFHTKPHAPISSDEVQKLCVQAGARVILGGATWLFESAFSVYDIWKNRNPDLLWDRPQNLLLYKKGGEIFCKIFSRPEFLFLKSMSSGLALDQIEEVSNGLSEMQIANLFQFLAKEGVIVGQKKEGPGETQGPH